ncbi:MAG: response regulator [Betaproteobacteria bacterium]
MRKPAAVRVLIVDDNADLRSFARLVLERAGFEAEEAPDGERALKLQRERPADVLVTDIFMSEPDGIELIQRFKARFPRVKVVAITGGAGLTRRGRKEVLFVAKELGAAAVLEKPFAGDALVTTVQSLAAGPGQSDPG